LFEKLEITDVVEYANKLIYLNKFSKHDLLSLGALSGSKKVKYVVRI